MFKELNSFFSTFLSKVTYGIGLLSSLFVTLPVGFAAANPPMIEVGVGGSTSQAGAELLFVARGDLLKGDQFFLAKLSGQVGLGREGARFLDIELRSLGYTLRLGGELDSTQLIHDFTLVNLNVKRDLDLGLGTSANVSFLGYRGRVQGSSAYMPDLKFYAEATIDLVSMGFIERVQDQARIDGGSFMQNGKIEFGAEQIGKFKVALGFKATTGIADPIVLDQGKIVCRDEVRHPRRWSSIEEDYYTDYSDSYIERVCEDASYTIYRQRAFSGEFYASVSAQIYEHLSGFGILSYHVFSMTDDLDRFSSGNAGLWRLRFGLSYGF